MAQTIAQMVRDALATDPPTTTKNPLVNWLVDCVMEETDLPYDRVMYAAEIVAWEEFERSENK